MQFFRSILRRCLFPVAVSLGMTGAAHSHPSIPAVKSSELDPKLKGRVLVEEMNCVACHQSEVVAPTSRPAPRLAAVGGRINPTYLESFIAAPHSVKPSTLMPDLLGELPEDERKQVAKAITHYLVSLSKGEGFRLQAPDAVAAEHGQELFHSVGCVACHSPRDPDGKELLEDASVPIGELEKKYSFKSLSDFIRRPHAVRPSGRMPDMRLSGQEIDRITHYLLRKTQVPGHLEYTTWRGKVWEGLEGDVQKEKAGQVKDFALDSLGKVNHQTAVRYTGFLKIDKAGDYKFHFEFNGGSLKLNDEIVLAEAPSNRRGPKKLNSTASLKEGLNKIEVTYFHTGREPRFVFEMSGPGLEKGPINSDQLVTSDTPIPVVEPLTPDPELVSKGKEHFQAFGCAQCHNDVKAEGLKFPSLAELKPNGGCISGAKGAPRFDLSDEQKKLIAAALPEIEKADLNDGQMIDKTLVSMNCISCHEREGLGGISEDRNPYFTGTKESLGDQGRLPPPLTHVGAKLTKHWLTEVILHGGRQRKYLNTRMPLFGENNVGHLIDRFEKVDKLEEVKIPDIANIRESKDAGYEMVGSSGFSCIACHDFNGQESSAGAMELIGVTERLKKNWFHLYMRQPHRFHPTVIMPSYWPGGESIRKELLNGDTDQQIEALWAYLADGPKAKQPKGLSRQSPQLRVADETLMCRGRGTAGYRGIGVGYPERISLAFDSEEMAVKLMWKGDFASVNHGSFRALGNDKITFPAGIPFHRLKAMDDLWPYKGKTNFTFPQDHGYQYRGYFLDKNKRPTFMYHYGDVAVHDFFEDLLDDEGKAFFRRTMTFETPSDQEAFYFRAGSGKQIKQDGSSWQLDRLSVRLPEKQKAVIRDGDPQDLLIPLKLSAGKTTLTVEYQW